MPFYCENKYFNLTFAKARFLWIIGGTLLLIYIFTRGIRLGLHIKKKQWTIRKELSMLDISIFMFGVSAITSCAFSLNPQEAFWGSAGWSMGVLTLTIVIVMYWVIKKYACINRYLIIIVAVSVGVLGVWGVVHSFRVDIGNMHEGIKNDFFDYIMTIGNVNWYVGLLSMIFPMVCMLFLCVQKRWQKMVIISYIDLISYNLVICRSNGIFLGIIFSGLVIVAYLIVNRKYIWNFLTIVINVCGILGIVWIIKNFYQGEFAGTDSFFGYIIENKIWFYIGVGVCVILLIRKSYMEYKIRNMECAMGKCIKRLQAACVCHEKDIYLICIVLGMSILLLYEALSFSDKWGTNRGVLWIYTIKIFENFKWKYKLFGCGCDCFGIVFMGNYAEYVKSTYLNAHNEFLQYLITMGIFGFVFYTMIWNSVIVQFVRKKKHETAEWVLFSAILGYLGQALINNPQALNYAVLFIILALFSSENTRKIPSYAMDNGRNKY